MQDGEPSRGILLDCKITPGREFWYYLIDDYCKMTPNTEVISIAALVYCQYLQQYMYQCAR